MRCVPDNCYTVQITRGAVLVFELLVNTGFTLDRNTQTPYNAVESYQATSDPWRDPHEKKTAQQQS